MSRNQALQASELSSCSAHNFEASVFRRLQPSSSVVMSITASRYLPSNPIRQTLTHIRCRTVSPFTVVDIDLWAPITLAVAVEISPTEIVASQWLERSSCRFPVTAINMTYLFILLLILFWWRRWWCRWQRRGRRRRRVDDNDDDYVVTTSSRRRDDNVVMTTYFTSIIQFQPKTLTRKMLWKCSRGSNSNHQKRTKLKVSRRREKNNRSVERHFSR